mmetsp:Transcript_24070/g.82080  ORF Transcript_24070/g.82080 Transcript_24070/m.82080 type:complete len:494 (+) Transcript_24070:52-1533(+)
MLQRRQRRGAAGTLERSLDVDVLEPRERVRVVCRRGRAQRLADCVRGREAPPRVALRGRQAQAGELVVRPPTDVRPLQAAPRAGVPVARDAERELGLVLQVVGVVVAPDHVPEVEHVRRVVPSLVQERCREHGLAGRARRAVVVLRARRLRARRRVVQRLEHHVDAGAHPVAQARVLLRRGPAVVVRAAARHHGLAEGHLDVDDVGHALGGGAARGDAVAGVVAVAAVGVVRGDVLHVRAANHLRLVVRVALLHAVRALHLVAGRGQRAQRVGEGALRVVVLDEVLQPDQGVGSADVKVAAEGGGRVQVELDERGAAAVRGRRGPLLVPVRAVVRDAGPRAHLLDNVLLVHLARVRPRAAHALQRHDVARAELVLAVQLHLRLRVARDRLHLVHGRARPLDGAAVELQRTGRLVVQVVRQVLLVRGALEAGDRLVVRVVRALALYGVLEREHVVHVLLHALLVVLETLAGRDDGPALLRARPERRALARVADS